LRRVLLVAIVLLIVSVILIPISYTPARVEIRVDKKISMDTETVDLVEKILGLEGSLKAVLNIELYANLSCGVGARIVIYYMKEAREIYLEPLKVSKLPVNDTAAIISIPKSPGCSINIEGGIEYLAYRYVWLSALSFIFGLSGGIMLLRILLSRISES
jgi:hypothetical protein